MPLPAPSPAAARSAPARPPPAHRAAARCADLRSRAGAGPPGSGDWQPLRRDDFCDGLVAAVENPVDELRGCALRDALGHHPEVTHSLVLTGLRVTQRARDALEADRVGAADE